MRAVTAMAKAPPIVSRNAARPSGPHTTVIVMENIDRELTAGDTPHGPVHLKILRAAQEVGGPMFFSTIIS
jgi:hypothetical protein